LFPILIKNFFSEKKMECVYTVDGSIVSLKVTPPQYGDVLTNDRLISTNTVMVIDVSGSMNSAATVTNDDGDKVNHGWSLLDIVKHSANTFSGVLGKNDKLSIVTFSDNASILLDWTCCADEQKETIETAIMSMRPLRTTNYAAGITAGFQQIDKLQETSENFVESFNLLFFTDGVPTTSYNPGRGYVHLCDMMQSQLKCKVHMTTIGLGNSLDSKLLANIAPFGFIYLPDPGSIGPNICNLVAHMKTIAHHQSTVFSDSTIRIFPPSSLKSSVAYNIVNATDEFVDISIGPLIYDIPRTFVFEVSDFTSIQLVQKEYQQQFVQRFVQVEEAVPFGEVMRSKIVEQLNRIFLPVDTTELQILLRQMDGTDLLFQTMTEEMLPGLIENYHSWGKHFLNALPPMLRDQRRSNFRDKCLQQFMKAKDGTDSMFEKISSAAEAIFATTTPPTPSLAVSTTTCNTLRNASTAPTVLPDEYLRGGGCWHENGKVIVKANNVIVVTPTNMVKPNDLVYTRDGSYARVICIVKRNMRNVKLSQIDDLLITEWHPVFMNNEWVFPHNVATRNYMGNFSLYDFVLEHSHIVMVDNIPCVTLGHEFEMPIVKHNFYGSHKVIEFLQSFSGWSNGFIEIE
jgi:hypothetical protein